MINFIFTNSPSNGNKWRNIVAAVVLLFSIGGIIMYTVDVIPTSILSSIAQNIRVTFLNSTNEKNNTVGGDMVFEHTPKIVPVLFASSTMPDPDSFTAVSIIAKDIESNTVLYAKNEYEQYPIASISKLMSALVLLEHQIDWSTSTSVVADTIVDTHMYAQDTYTLEDLWNAGLVGSSNKAILTLIDATGWQREVFVARMNEKAYELGMSQTFFADPTGIDERNVSTASDLVHLLHEALQFEKIKDSLLLTEYSLYSKERDKEHHMWNTNWLLLGWVQNAFVQFNGGKTGYIPASGYNFTMEVSDAAGHTIDVVVLGTNAHEARFTEARDVAAWVFANYEWLVM